ncbi:MAG TPA: hypothetical protein VF070_41090 [Streptosporangiaceae bacterium]
MTRFAVAFAASSFLVFAIVGAIGQAAKRALPSPAQAVALFAVLSLAALLDLYSLRRKTWCPVTPRRQTPKMIFYTFGQRRAALAWGADTGLVFTTYRMSSISWALLVLDALGIAPWWVGLGYSTGFLVPLVLGCSFGSRWVGDGTGLAVALTRRGTVARATCALALLLAITLVALRAVR